MIRALFVPKEGLLALASWAALMGREAFWLVIAVAEADGNRTRPPVCRRRTGFEDQEGHQTPFASEGGG